MLCEQKTKIECETLVRFDNCFENDKEWIGDSFLYELLFNGRHYNISYILIVNYIPKLLPELRSNFDYVFFCGGIDNKKILYKSCNDVFSTFKMFNDTYDQLTDNDNSMVIVNTGRINSITDKIFKFSESSKSKIPENKFLMPKRYSDLSFDDLSPIMETEESLEFKNFDLSMINKNSLTLIIGKEEQEKRL